MIIEENNEKATIRKVTVEVPFEGSTGKAIRRATKLLYNQVCEGEYCSEMHSRRKGDKIFSTMTFKKK